MPADHRLDSWLRCSLVHVIPTVPLLTFLSLYAVLLSSCQQKAKNTSPTEWKKKNWWGDLLQRGSVMPHLPSDYCIKSDHKAVRRHLVVEELWQWKVLMKCKGGKGWCWEDVAVDTSTKHSNMTQKISIWFPFETSWLNCNYDTAMGTAISGDSPTGHIIDLTKEKKKVVCLFRLEDQVALHVGFASDTSCLFTSFG